MKAVYIYPGQGSQYKGMGLDLYDTYPSAKAVFDRADEVLGFPLSKLCFEGPEEELTRTVNAQPALLVMSIACLRAVRRVAGDLLPLMDFAAGHSLGEYTALVSTGAFEFDTAVSLARERGRLMYEAGLRKPGAMAAIIGMGAEVLAKVCSETGAFIANINCPGQIVVSGEADSVKGAMTLAKERGAKLAIPLQVSGAFHSPLMRPAAEGMKEAITSVPFYAPAIPVIGNTKAQILDTAEAVRDELIEQVCSCVQWEDTVRYLLSQGVDTFVEIGPGDVLTGLVQRIDPYVKIMNIGSVEDIEALRA